MNNRITTPSLLLAGLVITLSQVASAQQQQQQPNRSRIVRNAAPTGTINNSSINQALIGQPVYGPNVVDVDRGLANVRNRIQPDWDAAKLISPAAIAHFMPPQQQQQFMSANGISPIGNTGFVSVAQKYNGPAGSLGISAHCAQSVYSDWSSGRPTVNLLKGNCAGSFSGLIVTYQTTAAGGGALLDCAFKSNQVTALRARVLGRDDSTNGFSIVLGETLQSFPQGAEGSLPVAIKKKPGTAPPISIKIDIPENGGSGLIDLYGCTVTPLA